MPDREKIIKGLKLCASGSECIGRDCPYWHNVLDDAIKGCDCTTELVRDALALLKEQETSNTGKARIFQCEKCGYGFDDIFLTDEHNYDIEPNYCPNCGRPVK